MDGLILFDPNNNSESQQQQQEQQRVSFMTGFQSGINEPVLLSDGNEDEDGFEFGEQQNSYAYGRSYKAKQTIKDSYKPANHLFDLLEMEIGQYHQQ